MKKIKFLFMVLLTGFTFIHYSWASCSGEYNYSCGADCCYKMVGTKAIIQDGSTYIRNEAFYGSSITSIDIPASITTIGDSAFNRAYNLTEVTFAEGSNLKQINYAAFYETEKLTHISLPSKLENIGLIAFAGSGIKEITLSDDVVIPRNSILQTDWAGAPILNLNSLVFKCAGDIKKCHDNLITGGLQSGSFNLIQEKNKDGSFAYYDNQDNLYLYHADGSTSVYDANGKLIGLKGKRILTVEEASALVKDNKNTFTLKYR